MPKTGDPAERAAFLRRILENPLDDTTRLVFADWLTENGEEKYGDYIRFSVFHQDTYRQVAFSNVSAHDRHKTQLYISAEHGHRDDPTMFVPLKLMISPSMNWTPRPNSEIKGPNGGWPTGAVFYYLRGFVQVATFPDMSLFMSDHVVNLFKTHPITEVHVVDKNCGEINIERGLLAVWQRQSVTMEAHYNAPNVRAREYMIPDEIYAEIPQVDTSDSIKKLTKSQTYPRSRDEGMKWLSDACVTWARKKVGLPPLQPTA